MPVGTVVPANSFRVSVATAAVPATFDPVSLMNTADVSADENSADFDVFDSDDPIALAGKQRRTLTVSGYMAAGDTGQARLLAAAAAKTGVVVKFLWDGTNGFTQLCSVNAYKGGARAGNQPTDISFDFKPLTAAGTIVGTGPVL